MAALSSVHAAGFDVLRSRHLWLRLAAGSCGAILLALGGTFALLLHSGTVVVQQTDMLVYVAAAHVVQSGHGGLYDFSHFRRLESVIVDHRLVVRREAVFLYPPFFALLLAPLASVSFALAYSLWLSLNALLLLCCTRALQLYARLDRLSGTVLGAAALSFFPVFAALSQGQVSILLLGSLVGTLWALRTGRDLTAGLALSVMLIKPPYLLPLLLVLVVQRRWRVLSGFVVAATALALAPLPVLGFRSDQHYVQALLRASRWHSGGGFTSATNHNLAGFTHLLLPSSLAQDAQVLLSVMALAVLAVLAMRVKRTDFAFAAAVCVALLVNPHVLLHDLTILLVPAAVALGYRNARRGLNVILVTGYVGVLVGIRLVTVLPFQLSVLATASLFAWLVVAGWCPAALEQPLVVAGPRAGQPLSPVASCGS